ncbi:MAG: hypothetical protein WCG25_04385 [bacterium]
MKTKFFLKQKGGNKIKDYHKARKIISELASKQFGCDVEDMHKTHIYNSIIIHDQGIGEISQEKFLKKIKSSVYLFEEIIIDNQKLILLINFGNPVDIQSESGYRKHLFPEKTTLIYVQTKNL